MTTRSAGACAVGLLLAGCVMSRQDILIEFKEQVLPRAAFELNCPEEQLSANVLTTNDDYRDGFASTVGVQGCNKRNVYVKSFPTGWVLNSSQPDDGPKK